MLITGIGQCCWDELGRVARFPAVDSKCEVTEWEEQAGGPVATALVTVARLGLQCRFAGVVGDDLYGEKIRAALSAEGVDTSGLVVRAGASSQRAFIAVGQACGSRTIFWRRAGGLPLEADEVPPAFFTDSRFLLLDGLMSEVSLHAAREARAHGIPVMLDAGRVRQGMMELARLCDYVVAAEQFALDLGWDGSHEGVKRIASAIGVPVFTVTSGARGSHTWDGTKVWHVPAFTVDVVDTTGAGDVFHGGYLFGLLQGWPLQRVVTFAAAAAALKCGALGAQAGIPRRDTVERFLCQRGAGSAAETGFQGFV